MLAIALMASISIYAQTSEWQQQLEQLDKEFNELREQRQWKGVVANRKQYRKIFMAQPDSARMKFSQGTDLNLNFYYNYTCYLSLAGDKKEALSTFEYFTNRVTKELDLIDVLSINNDSDLDAIREEPRFKACMERLEKWGDYKQKLKNAKGYHRGTLPEGMKFSYMSPNHPDLVRLREKFNLDSVAGAGNEISKIKNLLHWVHNVVRHDGSSMNPEVMNTIAMVELCQKENRGVNCRMLAQMLTEVYLAMGFKARFVTCMPRDHVSDCHVITTVYSNTLNKWLWVDPTFEAYVMDENGVMLSIAEVRERLRNDQPLQLNEDANWNNRQKTHKEYYLDRYMAKNLYYLICMDYARFDAETVKEGRIYRYIALMPYDEINSQTNSIGWSILRVSDDEWFWQSPYLTKLIIEGR
ncbi:MAG: transglutaminase domain-containing protein [Alistipes sp.]|nr:transglutaminase domain-containing protein [Alistipes sp.]